MIWIRMISAGVALALAADTASAQHRGGGKTGGGMCMQGGTTNSLSSQRGMGTMNQMTASGYAGNPYAQQLMAQNQMNQLNQMAMQNPVLANQLAAQLQAQALQYQLLLQQQQLLQAQALGQTRALGAGR